MEIAPVIRSEWYERHALCKQSLAWLRQHADPGDAHPIVTAVEVLRANGEPSS